MFEPQASFVVPRGLDRVERRQSPSTGQQSCNTGKLTGMLNSPILQVAIGLVFTYTVLAMICSAANEAVAQAFNLRSQTLWQAIRNLLGDQDGTGLAGALYNHPLVSGLVTRGQGKASANIHDRPKPAYMSPAVFSTALLDVLGGGEAKSDLTLGAATARLNSEAVSAPAKRALMPLVTSAGADLGKAKGNIEAWFNQGMDRASGRYQQQTRLIIFYIAFLVTFTLNADTVMMVRQLWANPTERQALVTAAEKAPNPQSPVTVGAKQPAQTQPGPSLASQTDSSAAQVLFGWTGPWNSSKPTYDLTDLHTFPRTALDWLVKLFGLLLTAFAASLGAPFWFGVLNRLTNIRANGPAPSTKQTPQTTGGQ